MVESTRGKVEAYQEGVPALEGQVEEVRGRLGIHQQELLRTMCARFFETGKRGKNFRSASTKKAVIYMTAFFVLEQL